MVVPALLYLAFTAGGDGRARVGHPDGHRHRLRRRRRWRCSARASRPALKLFLLTLAIVDDIGAIVVIAVVYTDGVDCVALAVAVAAVVAAVVLRLGAR